jgi:PPM family protein phosphatase
MSMGSAVMEVISVAEFSDDSTSTEEDGLLDELRREGIIGPFVVSDWAADSDIGLVREENEDRWRVAGTTFVVADGMGGQSAGALAAETAVEVAERFDGPLSEASAKELCALANGEVISAGDRFGVPTLGTTLVVLSAQRNFVVVLSVGDSRVYRLRAGELELLTRDHTVRNELLSSGVDLDVAERSNLRLDALTSYIGRRSDHPLVSHIASYSVMHGDRFLLCTDGVHGQLETEAIEQTMGATDCRSAVATLLRSARQVGGRDNSTAVVVEFRSETS